MQNLTLILGGASSGKSAYAEQLVLQTGLTPVYLATAQKRDGEMAEKVARHAARRGPEWLLIEAPVALTTPIENLTKQHVVLLDCLTLWLSNLMEGEHKVEGETEKLLAAIEASPAQFVAVSNEIGMGLVPSTPLGRQFRDAQGQLNQRFAEAADTVIFVAAGLPLFLKEPK